MFKNLASGNMNPVRRVKNAIFGVLFGILMVPGSIILMGWNEYRSVRTIKSLNDTMKNVTADVDVSSTNPNLDGTLVHFSSEATTKQKLEDPVFKYADVAIKLRRVVETYQWVEDEDDDDDGPTTYRHHKEWDEAYHDSSQFHEPSGHLNLPPRLRSESRSAKEVTVGAYQLSDSILGEIQNFEWVTPAGESIQNFEGDLKEKIVVDGDYFYYPIGNSKTGSPVIGDQRIRLEKIAPQEYSVISTISGITFRPYQAKNGRLVELVEPGNLSAEKLIQHAKYENAVSTWIMRGVGFIVCLIGVALILGPITMVLDYVPFFGAIAKSGIFILAMLFSFVVSMMTISISWIAVRPMIGIPLFVLGVGGIAAIIYYGTRNRKQTLENQVRFGPAEQKFDDDEIDVVDKFH